MQRYHASGGTSAVNNGGIGGVSSRDTGRIDSSSSLSTSFPVNSRRSLLVSPYRLKCDKEPLNSRLGPPDFLPQTPNCLEETLTKEYVQLGYRETVDGLEDSREISLTQVPTFTKPVILDCKEAIRKCLRAINESRAQKRKAGQVYGVPLSGGLLSKPGLFPEQKPCADDFRKRWIEGLSQYHKSLHALADYIPHGFRKRALLEVLVKNNVPLLRATWFIKVTYLNQIRPVTSSVSSGTVDKNQLSRTELWTKDIIDYLQYLLDEYLSKNSSHLLPQSRDQSSLTLPGSVDLKNKVGSALLDGEEPSLHFKWWYVVRILHWHHAEGLIVLSQVIDWVLLQLKEKDLHQVLELLLPIIYGAIETIVLSQSCVRSLAEVALRFLRGPSPSCSDLVDDSRRVYTVSAVVEMLRYLILATPDTFVAVNCFPLPRCVIDHNLDKGSPFFKLCIDTNLKKGPHLHKGVDDQYHTLCFNRVLSSIQKRASYLGKAVSPGCSGKKVAKAVHALDKSLILGDIREAYRFVFEEPPDAAVGEGWIAEVSPCLRSSLKWIDSVSPSFIWSVFFLCEWCTCDFRDFRMVPVPDVKYTGRRDISQIYIAVRILKRKMRDMEKSLRGKSVRSLMASDRIVSDNMTETKNMDNSSIESSYALESPGPLHDSIVCWIDQHEAHTRDGLKLVHLLLMELIRSGIFCLPVYARQLIVSGVMDGSGPVIDLDRRKRHVHVLKQLPGSCMSDALEEVQIAQTPMLSETIRVYSNERRLLLRGLLSDDYKTSNSDKHSLKKRKTYLQPQKEVSLSSLTHQMKNSRTASNSVAGKQSKDRVDIEELKAAISVLLQLPSVSTCAGASADESQASVKKLAMLNTSEIEGTSGCEECRKAKRPKFTEDRVSYFQGLSLNLFDDEDLWWARKEPKSMELLKVDPPKPSKQASRGRQKPVRKTQSLAHLAAARIESSQGASTSHVCDNRVGCLHHQTGSSADVSKPGEGTGANLCGDVVSVAKMLKQLRLVEKRIIAVWLLNIVKQLIEETERAVQKTGQFNRPISVEERSLTWWKLGEDELSIILYLIDLSCNLSSAVRFLIWLLPKALGNSSTPIIGARNMMTLPRHVESYACEVGELFLLSSIKRYENILVAEDLIPEVLSAAMHRGSSVLASNRRISGSLTLYYARCLLKKYGGVPSVVEWENNFKTTCDNRLMTEIECGRLQNGEFGYPLGFPAGVKDLDEYIRQKITGNRISRAAMNMRDVVQRYFDDLQPHFGKDRKTSGASVQRSAGLEKWGEGHQIAQKIIMALMECIRQTGGAAQEGDPSLVSYAVSAIVGSVGPAISKLPDITSDSSTAGLLGFARRILRIHVHCLCLLKEALGERNSRVFEIALATEASSALAGAFSPGKAPRSQFQVSPEAHEHNANISNEASHNSNRTVMGKTTKVAAAVSSLVVGAVINGVASLERIVKVLRLKEGLDVMQFVKSLRSSNSNGSARSFAATRVDNSLEIYVHWFRLLVGNCRTMYDGLIVELLGEPSVVALFRMQRTLPLHLVLPPAYSIFAFMIWKPYIFTTAMANREDVHQLFQSLTSAIVDAMRHMPFRDVCLRDTQGFYDLMTSDATDSEFAAVIELNGSDRHAKAAAFVPLRARLFLNALVDCKLPHSVSLQDDSTRISDIHDPKLLYADSELKHSDKLVHALDTLQAAKFHWQWVEIRLFLNEQALIEKLDSNDSTSIAEAMRSLSPNPEKAGASENENNFISIVLTRLLVRPDSAAFFSEVVHLFGRSLEDSLLLQVKWFLAGQDVLFGRKSIRQRLLNIADDKGFSTKAQFWRPWGWCNSSVNVGKNQVGKRKFEAAFLEEGEVGEEASARKRQGRGAAQTNDLCSTNTVRKLATERALVELVLPCIDQSSDDSRNSFANDLIKQINNIEQQVSAARKQARPPSGNEGQSNKASSRKSSKGGSPGLTRRSTGSSDAFPLSPSALRSSISLRLQLLLRLLPVIWADREPAGRNMRFMLALVTLRLLGSRIVYEDADLTFNSGWLTSSKKDAELHMEDISGVSLDLSGKNLFDWLLLVLHAILSNTLPSWLKVKSLSKATHESTKDSCGLDRDIVESLQNELDRMQLPDMIRWRIQVAMPILPPNRRRCVSCQPPSVPTSALASLQPSVPISTIHPSQPGPSPRNLTPPTRTATNMPGKAKPALPMPEHELEIDPWTLLEDGAGSGPSSNSTAAVGVGDHANFKAASWLKGAARMRRTDLTYIGAIDDDS